MKGGKSLLPSGVIQVDGKFERGESVTVLGPDDEEIARGLVAYSAMDAKKLAGKQTREIKDTLGYSFGDALIHRNDLAVTK